VFQSQGGGTPNTFSGYLFAPLSQGALGEVLFLDVVANLNLGGALVQQTNVNAGASTRLADRDGRTPLQLAQARGHSAMVAALQAADSR
jgi:ankyrin repeat protein